MTRHSAATASRELIRDYANLAWRNVVLEIVASDKRALKIATVGFRVGFRPGVSGLILKT